MKALILAIGLLTGSFAFAHTTHHQAAKDCTPYSTNSGDVVNWVYPCGESYTVNYRACNEGEVGYFHVSDNSNGGYGQEVRRVCHNGTFFPAQSDATHRSCNEGEVAYSSEAGAGGYNQSVTVVCHHGHFVRAN